METPLYRFFLRFVCVSLWGGVLVFGGSTTVHAKLPDLSLYQWSLVKPPDLFARPKRASLMPTTGVLAEQAARPQLVAKAPKPHPTEEGGESKVNSSAASCSQTRRCDGDENSEALVKLLHQIFGIGSLVLMTATMIIGQINAVDFFEGRLSSQPMLWAHKGLALATAITYGGARVLAWVMPTIPEEGDSKGFDSAKAHRILGWLHGIGMIALIVGGVINARLIPSSTEMKVAMTAGHLAAGYFTWASLSAAAVVITFF